MAKPTDFFRFNLAAIGVAVGTILVSAIGLLALSNRDDSTFTRAAASVLGTVLGVGLVVILYESLLRRAFGRDLYQHLRLKEALVTSGLTDVSNSRSPDPHALLNRPERFTYVGRTPTLWLNEHFPTVLRAAEDRQLDIVIALPDPDSPDQLAVVAAGLDTTAEDLRVAINAFTAHAVSVWDEADKVSLRKGSTMRFMALSEAPTFDAYETELGFRLLVPRPLGHTVTDVHLVLEFSTRMDRFPRDWIEPAFEFARTQNAVVVKAAGR